MSEKTIRLGRGTLTVTEDGVVRSVTPVEGLTITFTNAPELPPEPPRPSGRFTIGGTAFLRTAVDEQFLRIKDQMDAAIIRAIAGPSEARRGIEERVYGPTGPLVPPGYMPTPRLRPGWWHEPLYGTHFTGCGISWDLADIERFLSKCVWQQDALTGAWCLLFNGARSRGKGNQAWYGSFWSKGKTVRAHKFFAVAILGLRPRPNREDELDHHCFNTRCVSCVQVLPYAENQKRIRRRKDYDAATQG